jgi:hypothetical protein
MASKATTPVPVRFGREERALLRLLQARASAADRSVSGQLKHYARLALIAEDNPDLPLSRIQGILEAQADLQAGPVEPYQSGLREPA